MGRKSNYENGMYQQLQDIMGRLETVEKESTEKINRLNKRIEFLEKENGDLKAENRLLHDDNARLKSIINNDSSNTSLPPSADQKPGKPANTFNGRQKTKRKAGGQKGHKGTALTRKAVEEKIKSGTCKHEIQTIGYPKNRKCIKKYVVDLNVETVIREIRIYADKKGKFYIPPRYYSDVTYGNNVKSLAVTLYSEGVMSNDRIASFLNAASNGSLELSEGSVYGFCRKFASNAENTVQKPEEELLNNAVVATDATTVTVNGIQNYVRNFSTEKTVVYHAMKNKTIKALKQLSFLKQFSGVLVHDHETALYHFGTEHAECNVHIIRYLRKNTEDTGNNWSKKMISLLCEMNKARKENINDGNTSFSEEAIEEYGQKYHALISEGRAENKKTANRYAKKEERALLNRMEKYSQNHLLFLGNFEVPFDDNISERDLRKVKNRQKMAGGFRKDSGHEMYCLILTVIETLKKRHMGLIENIKRLFMGTPAIF